MTRNNLHTCIISISLPCIKHERNLRTLAKSLCTQVPTEENTVAEKNHYLAYPIERIQENVYSATLTISNIGSNEADYQHFLQIRHPDIESPKEHW